VRVFGFNHIGHTAFADSSRPLVDGDAKVFDADEEPGGLSGLGRQAVVRINELGGLIDVSQMSKNATLQAIELSRTPVIATHSNARSESDVSRNLSDEEIDRIGETGGVIALAPFGAYLLDYSKPGLLDAIIAVRAEAGLPAKYSYPYELYWEIEDTAAKLAFLGKMRALIGPSSLARMIDHIDYVSKRIGIEHVAIGSDFNHGGGVPGFADASEAENVTKALVERGYTRPQIKMIWGENFLRVMRQAEASATTK
jgi:membrane dipeptidase